jgi:bifunctional UDP-N-acetylglucosamine pyrophosphorylase/glucosamine-1-phosphate N-acetyltransferase
MKAVILAAGKGMRLRPLTATRPKALLPVANRPVLEWNLSELEGIVDEAVIVTGYMGENIRSHLGGRFKNIRLTYVEQKEQLGTGHALMQTSEELKGRFIVLMGDDLYGRAGIQAALKQRFSVLVQKGDTRNFGACISEAGLLSGIAEKSKKHVSDLINTGLYVLDDSIFSCTPGNSARGEHELTDMIVQLAGQKQVSCVEGTDWIPIGYPWDLLAATEAMLKKHGSLISPEAVISSRAGIEGPAAIGPDAVLKDCVIRPYTAIGAGAVIGNFVEVKNSIIMEKTHIPHLSYVGDSIIGANCNLGAGTKAANLRFDHANIRIKIEAENRPVDSGRKKFGCIMGDGTQTGINVSLMPGTVIPEGSLVGTGIYKGIVSHLNKERIALQRC